MTTTYFQESILRHQSKLKIIQFFKTIKHLEQQNRTVTPDNDVL